MCVLIQILRDVCEMDTDPVLSMLDEAKKEMQQAKLTIAQRIQNMLENEAGISGSAVEPNIEADGEYAAEIEAIQFRLRKALDQVIQKPR